MDGGSVGQLKAFCARALRENNITDTPELEARLLIKKATSLSQVEQILHPDRALDENQVLLLERMLTERLHSRPMAYILGSKEFYGRCFYVDERTLIPRPDTETLVDTALSYARKRKEKLSIIDVCTGSGCVGISIACELGYDVHLSDISSDALEVARTNALALVGHELPTSQGNLLSTLPDKYDIIVSNPPYLTALWCDEVDAGVKREPRLALEGFGPDGLDLIRTLVEQSASALRDKGALMMECDYRQVAEVREIMLASGFIQVQSECDLTGRERVVWGIYNCTNN
ncbi:MAG TPA: peptide chain release factor N(5)-glutamine methyltransferase [Spirochaetales bacterium]|nr:peptide chain release factor N(5)-glutamine methyltransferase [Spirochaetales bacterium]